MTRGRRNHRRSNRRRRRRGRSTSPTAVGLRPPPLASYEERIRKSFPDLPPLPLKTKTASSLVSPFRMMEDEKGYRPSTPAGGSFTPDHVAPGAEVGSLFSEGRYRPSTPAAVFTSGDAQSGGVSTSFNEDCDLGRSSGPCFLTSGRRTIIRVPLRSRKTASSLATSDNATAPSSADPTRDESPNDEIHKTLVPSIAKSKKYFALPRFHSQKRRNSWFASVRRASVAAAKSRREAEKFRPLDLGRDGLSSLIREMVVDTSSSGSEHEDEVTSRCGRIVNREELMRQDTGDFLKSLPNVVGPVASCSSSSPAYFPASGSTPWVFTKSDEPLDSTPVMDVDMDKEIEDAFLSLGL
ncbi:hypothetical protein HDU67_007339 [Dinochytrium kinnereticum]|nr:hypothetical protein HDU67_007339 [Dinochytrium kinnereticum]